MGFSPSHSLTYSLIFLFFYFVVFLLLLYIFFWRMHKKRPLSLHDACAHKYNFNVAIYNEVVQAPNAIIYNFSYTIFLLLFSFLLPYIFLSIHNAKVVIKYLFDATLLLFLCSFFCLKKMKKMSRRSYCEGMFEAHFECFYGSAAGLRLDMMIWVVWMLNFQQACLLILLGSRS